MDIEEKKKINVLYVDDEIENLSAFKASFRRFFNVYIAESASEAEKILEQNEVEVILTDQRMPKTTGIEFLQSIVPKYPEAIRILVTGYSDINAVKDAINKGEVYRYIEKPWDTDFMKMIIEKSYEVYSLRKKNKQLTEDLIRVNKQLEFMLRQKLIS